eukprot:609406-Pleurochrysis_carterae.AAC.1
MHATETTRRSWTNSSAAETSGGVREEVSRAHSFNTHGWRLREGEAGVRPVPEGIGEESRVAAIADGYTRQKQD